MLLLLWLLGSGDRAPAADAGSGQALRAVVNKVGSCEDVWARWPAPGAPLNWLPEVYPDLNNIPKTDLVLLARCETMWNHRPVHYQCGDPPGADPPLANWSARVIDCPVFPFAFDTNKPDFPEVCHVIDGRTNYHDAAMFGYPRRSLLAQIEPLCHDPSMTGWSEQEEVKIGSCAQEQGVMYLMSRVDAAAIARRVVYVDLGSRDYAGVNSKLRRLPHWEAFNELVLFELDAKFYDGYKDLPAHVRFYKGGAFIKDGYLEFRQISMASLDEGAPLLPVDERGPPEGAVRVFDLARVLQEDLRLTPRDFVVVKMDIECTEYVLLPHLIKRGMQNIIDEIFVEAHWGSACKGQTKTRGDAECMFKSARDAGLYVHDDGQPYLWPGVPYSSKNVVHQ